MSDGGKPKYGQPAGGQRTLPPELEPVGTQALVNLALSGCKIIAPDGTDVTSAAAAAAHTTNAAYDRWLDKYRDLTAHPSWSEASAERRARIDNQGRN